MDTNEPIFSDISGNRYDLPDIVERAHMFIAAKPRERYEIIIGSDSHPSQPVHFVTAVTIRRIGNGGIYFWTRSTPEQCHTLRDRIYREAMHSITLAQELRGRLKETLGDEFFWNDQVHIDVGERGDTRDLVPGVVGMVRGFGFEAVIKPDAFGACVVADRHT
ncbi:MAG: hypothetical protein G01um101470_455 [Parcubacteria group bacterium Gr01-1014_70]|nr:MAG: hypothetical protein G01um101470_455 [Parcubacteria group bacterium Gr01-1014_70]